MAIFYWQVQRLSIHDSVGYTPYLTETLIHIPVDEHVTLLTASI